MEKKDGKNIAINFCQNVFNNLLLVFLLLNLSAINPQERNYSLFEYTCELEDRVERIQEKLFCVTEEFLMDSHVKAAYLNRNDYVENYIRKYQRIPGTNNIIIKESVTNPKISNKMLAAWLDYTGPLIYGTSLTRGWNTWSDHANGLATDISYSPEFILWTGSTSGKAWIKKHNIRFFIEDNCLSKSLKRWLGTEFRSHVKVNRRATARHIHIFVK